MLINQLSMFIYFPIYLILFYIFNMFLEFIAINIYFSELFIFSFVFVLSFTLNFCFWGEKLDFELESELEDLEFLNLDLYIKFTNLFEKNYSFFTNLIKTEFKKFFLFFIKFKHAIFLYSLKMFLKRKIKHMLVLWRPIFKKWSYLGYYRSNQSKWIK